MPSQVNKDVSTAYQQGYHTGSKRWRADLKMAQIDPFIPMNSPTQTLGAIDETPAIVRSTSDAVAASPSNFSRSLWQSISPSLQKTSADSTAMAAGMGSLSGKLVPAHDL
jgi:hypothetical protein